MTHDGDALLSDAELVELTRKRRYKAQARALGKMGIRYMQRPDGSIVVSRALVTAILARYTERPPEVAAPARKVVVNWDAMRARRKTRKA